MNRTRSILLAATALTLLGTAGQASAQNVDATGLTLLGPPPAASANNDIFPDSLIVTYGITADGSTVLISPFLPDGSPNAAIQNPNQNIFLFTNGVMRTISVTQPTPAIGRGIDYASTGMSGDGNTIIGRRIVTVNRLGGGAASYIPATIWTQATGLQFFASPRANEFVAFAKPNMDGSLIAVTVRPTPLLADGSSNPARFDPRTVYRYSPTSGFQSLGSLGATVSMTSQAISGAGDIIAGGSSDLAASNLDANGDPITNGAWRWSATSGLSVLPDLVASPLNGTIARNTSVGGISRDGSTVVGGSVGSDGRRQAVYWRGGTITGLGLLSGFPAPSVTDFGTFAFAASADGSVIVGAAGSGINNLVGWHWTAFTGMQDLNVLARNAGLNLNGFVLADTTGISDNGQFITGNAYKGGLDALGAPLIGQGYVLSIAAAPPPATAVSFLSAPAPQPARCGGTTGTNTFASAISADGSVVLGGSDFTPGCIVVLRWSNGVPEAIPGVSAIPANLALRRISGASADGQVFTVDAFQPTSDPNFPYTTRDQIRARYWTPSTLFQAFPDPSPTQVVYLANGVSSDGRYFAVNSSDVDPDTLNNSGLFTIGGNRRALRWSLAGGYEDIGNLGSGGSIRASGISGDGGIIVGQDTVSTTLGTLRFRSAAFRWQSGAGIAQLPDLASAPRIGTLAPSSAAIGISRDGSTIFGQSRGDDGFNQAVIWRGGTITGLGFLPGYAPTGVNFGSINATVPQAANANGSIIVGFIPTADASLAWRWTATSGMQDLNLFAANAGVNLGGYVLNDAVGLSDDGQFIAGNAFNAAQNQSRGYVLSIAAAPPPPTTLSTTARLIVTLTLPGVTQTSIVNQSFSTQVDGLLNGRNVFTRTVADQITGTGGVTALADARTALQVGGGLRRLAIGAPVLISNTTTVLNSTSNTVNVASGTQVTNAAVLTNGPATVATGDLGTCATAATNGVNPTGCSLPGTPVSVNANVINTNTFTNTINSVTPTTTTTVNQLISARWQVSATAGNQFGTVHALVGPVAFERGDRLIGQLIDLGGAGGAAPVTRAAVGGSGLTMFGGYFGNWANIDADARVPVASVRGNTDGFVLGLEKALGDARIAVAVDHGTSSYDVRDATYPETLSMKHTQVGLFANWKSGGFSLDGAAAYGFGSVRTTLTTPTTPATATRDVRSWSVGAQAGYGVDVDVTRISLVAGVRHSSAKLNAFTETGGPSPLTGLARTVQRTRVYGGVEVATRLNLGGVTLTPRVHARAASDSGDASGVADLVFASAPNGPVMQAIGPGVGRTVAELGGSLDMAVSGNVHLWAGYDGTFRSGARSHAAKAGVTVNW